MKTAFALASGKIPAVILACMLLAACSTTQKGSTGSGTQDAAPISEAGKEQPAAAGGSPDSSPAVQSGTPADAASQGAPAGATPPATAGRGDEEAARLQQQLADQEAEINRMRDEQVKAQQLADEEAARQRAGQNSAQPGTTSGATQGGAAAQAPAEASAGGGGVSQQAAAESAQPGDQPVAGQPLTRSIYFKYDDATIGDEYDSVLVSHAAFLKANPDFKAEVQGNCDDRGSREYNLALGARRAEAVKRGLELAGADGANIKTVSFGAEKPVAFGQDEESYRQNRRADILY
jgi:peptidoglycan-associated lipoprotein